jgi:hypothetical protein
MKKVLATAVAVVLMVGAGAAQKFKTQVSPALTSVGASNYVAVFTDNSGDLGDSLIYQSGGNVGIGTLTPAATLDVAGANPTLRVDNYSNTVGDSPNFNFITGRGTAASPLATQSGDNLGQFAAAGYNGSAFPGSKVKVTFVATEDWTTSANGTAMSFQTTANGTTARTSRLFIDNTGNVGIGSIFGPLPATAPGSPLTVNGIVQSTGAGGFKFPDGTTQVTAAVSGVALTSDGSITVGGSGTAALTVAANTAVVQKRVAGTCAAGSALTAVNADGSVGCGTIGPGGTAASVPVVVANTSFTGGYGLGTAQTIYTAATSGFYRVSVYMNVPTLGTCSSIPCAGEAIAVRWNDGVSTTARTTATCDLTVICGSSVVTPIWVQSGQAISAFGQSYDTGTAPSGAPSYKAYVLVEQM